MNSVELEYAKKACAHFEIPASKRSRADYEQFFDLLAQDVVLRSMCPSPGTEIIGKTAIIDYVNDFLRSTQSDEADDLELERPLEYIGDGIKVAIVGAENVKVKTTRKVIETKEFVILLEFRDHLIKRIIRFSQ